MLSSSTSRTVSAAFASAVLAAVSFAQVSAPATPLTPYIPAPAFDVTSIDMGADPCNDFYKFACGNFANNHPIPSDQTSTNQFNLLSNLNTQALNDIVAKLAAGSASRTPNEQKVGDTYASCMDTSSIEKKDRTSIQPLLDEIGRTGKPGLVALSGKLQRIGVNAFFSYGEMQDFKDATRQIAVIDQGGLGLPERDYYFRVQDKDKTVRDQYVAHIAKILSFVGDTSQKALAEANAILAFETTLAKASQSVTDSRDPASLYHLETTAQFETTIPHVNFAEFLDTIHSPHIAELNVMNPGFMPALVQAIASTDIGTLHAYLRYQLLTQFADRLPKRFDNENFDFYGRKLRGQPDPTPRWKLCSKAVSESLGEALGQIWVQQYFAGDAKEKTLDIVLEIEHAMDKDIGQLEWMSPATKVRAKEKLHAVTNKIGYPDKWRDYSSLSIIRDDAVGNAERSTAFESDRQLDKIGKPVDKLEWNISPPTVNAGYDPGMNNISFPAGILQPVFYDPKADDAVNYGHMGAVVGHELTHGFDDQGRQFDAKGNFSDWWTADDAKKFEVRTGCLVDEYSSFVAVDDVHIQGKLTLGENIADNGGLLLAYMAYLDRAKKRNVDLAKKVDGFTSPQRFYIAYAQNWCENTRAQAVRRQVLTNTHSPSHFRVNGAIVNQPAFGAAFSCKKGTLMVPSNACQVW
jgi:putative endopeptidase